MKFSQMYPQIMNFYEKRQNNEYFRASNTIDFGKKASRLYSLSFDEKNKNKTYNYAET